MRVLYCTDTYPPQVNGVSVVTALSVRGLRERGWECHVIAPSYERTRPQVFEQEIVEDVPGGTDELTRIPTFAAPGYPDIRVALPTAYFEVRRAIARFQPDLVHCATEFVIGRLGQIAASRLRVPAVTSYHTDFSRYTAEYGVPWLEAGVSGYIGRFHRRALRTFTPSEASRDDLKRMGVARVEVWGRGVDTDLFTPARRSMPLRTELGLGGAFTFLYVGRVAAEKGVDVVIEAFRQVQARLPAGSVRLVIAGEGPDQRVLRMTAPPNTVFVGFLNRQTDLPNLYASADAFVFPSVTETLGLVVLEALASGLPVVASLVGGVTANLVDGVNGLACTPRDAAHFARAMERLALDHHLTARLAEGARHTAVKASWATELDRLDVSYREVLDAVARKAEVAESLRGSALAPHT